MHLDVEGRPEDAGGGADRDRRQVDSGGDPGGLLQRGFRRERDHRRGRNRFQVVRPEEVCQAMDDLRELVVELLAQKPREEGDPFEKTLYVGVRRRSAEHRGEGRMRARELRPQLPKGVQLLLVILVEHSGPGSFRSRFNPSSEPVRCRRSTSRNGPGGADRSPAWRRPGTATGGRGDPPLPG